MYAWCLAVQTANVSIIHQAPPNSLLLSQPPHDHVLGKAAMFHYTWGVIYKKGEKDIWKFDKRFYTAADDALKVWAITALQSSWLHPLCLLACSIAVLKQCLVFQAGPVVHTCM